MTKRIAGTLLLLCLILSAAACAEGIVLPASEAAFDATAEGLSLRNTLEPMTYDAEHDLIVNVADGAAIVFTVPEDAAGTFDLYLTFSKSLAPYSSQPFIFHVNDERAFSVPVDADAPDGTTHDADLLLTKGQALIRSGLALSAGDRITVTAAFGARGISQLATCYPAVGDLLLIPVESDMPDPLNPGTPPIYKI